MIFINQLKESSQKNNSLLCVGLDIDLNRLPKEYLSHDDPIFAFNKKIIDETKDLVCAYKPNIAFYEAHGVYGLQSLIRTIEYIPKKIPVILDAKRGDIGNTAQASAKSIFEIFKASATTVNPYMGRDSIDPFLEYKDKGTFILCLTSNPGFKDFQTKGDKEPLYINVAKRAKEWNQYGNCGLVVGATNPEELKKVRKVASEMPFLIPGVGAQGGDLRAAVKYGTAEGKAPIVINAARSIIYATRPREAAEKLRNEINIYR